MTELKRKYEIMLYAGVFLLGVLLFTIIRVPSEKLARIATAYAGSAGFQVAYDSVDSTLLPGFQLSNVRISSNDGAPLLDLAKLTARATLLPLITGKAGVLISADVFGGSLKSKVLHRGEENFAAGKISGVDLDQIKMVSEKLQLPVHGTLDAEFDVNILPALNQSVGTVDVALNDFRFDKGKLLGTFDFPGADFGDVHGALLLENGRVIFDRFAGDGQDVKVTIDGDVALNDDLAQSVMNLNLKLKLSSRLEQTMGFAFPLLGLVKSPQGEYVRHVGGTFSAPR